MTLLLLDIDFFKKVNDTHGHLTGDAILKGVAKLIQHSFRILDIVARYGGEEFAVLLIEPNNKGAYEAAERVRKKIEKKVFEKNLHVTISIGMRTIDKDSSCTSALQLIEEADRALYQAKEGGRNQIVVFQEAANPQRKMKRV